MTIISEEFGCPQEVMDRIAEALEMSSEQLERTGLDFEVLDSARWLVEQGIKVETAEQVRASGAPIIHGYRGFLEAVVIAAKNLQMEI